MRRYVGHALSVLLLLAAIGLGARFSGQMRAMPVPAPQPRAVAAFLDAFSHGDEADADRLASPLYRAEWARRQVTSAQRAALRPAPAPGAAPGAPWIAFTAVSGYTDAAGFGHRLYLARPTCVCPGASVWRVDTEPSGRVIWLELVWLFQTDDPAPSGFTSLHDLTAVPLPAALAARAPRLVVGIRANRDGESYDAVEVAKAADDDASLGGRRVVWFGIDEWGQARPGVWSYGDASNGLVTYGSHPTPVPFGVGLGPDATSLLRLYRASL